MEENLKPLCLLLLVWALLLFVPHLAAQSEHESHQHHDGMVMSDEPLDTAAQAKLLADKNESEFNHHLAGFFVALGGLFILFSGIIEKKLPAAKFAWPSSFLLSGVFVLVWSDTELWPFGPRQWLEALQNNREVLQHKTFAALLLGLGIIEWLRVKETLKTVWSGLVFPVLAIAGSILLLFHQHEAGMHGPNHMELMAKIQSEHWSYAMVGLGIGVSKGVADFAGSAQRIFAKIWPTLLFGLGVLLMFYRE